MFDRSFCNRLVPFLILIASAINAGGQSTTRVPVAPPPPVSTPRYLPPLPYSPPTSDNLDSLLLGQRQARRKTIDVTNTTDTTGTGWAKGMDFSGPRFGVTVLSPSMVDSLANHRIHVGTMITQFGWQFERQFYASPNGLAALTEFLLLGGGMERGTILPSGTWVVGIRSRSGLELGVGPNVSVSGVALAMASGVTLHADGINFPVNMGVVSSADGVRVTMLVGFTMH